MQKQKHEFLEKFLKWNFRGLSQGKAHLLRGSPFFAECMISGLATMKISSSPSIILLEGVFYNLHRERMEDIMRGESRDLTGAGAHFVVGTKDGKSNVYYDMSGDITRKDRRVMLIHSVTKEYLRELLLSEDCPKIIEEKLLEPLKVTFSRMNEIYTSKDWEKYPPYWEMVKGLRITRRIKRHSRGTLRKRPKG